MLLRLREMKSVTLATDFISLRLREMKSVAKVTQQVNAGDWSDSVSSACLPLTLTVAWGA